MTTKATKPAGLELPAFLNRATNGIKSLPVATAKGANVLSRPGPVATVKAAPAAKESDLVQLAAAAIESGKVKVTRVPAGMTAEKAKAAKVAPAAPATVKAAPASTVKAGKATVKAGKATVKAAKAGKVKVAKKATVKATARKVATVKAAKAGKVKVAKAEPRELLAPKDRTSARLVKALPDSYVARNGIVLTGKNAIMMNLMSRPEGISYGNLKAALGWKNCRVTAGRVAARCGAAVSKSGGKGDDSIFRVAFLKGDFASAKDANAALSAKAGKAGKATVKAAPASTVKAGKATVKAGKATVKAAKAGKVKVAKKATVKATARKVATVKAAKAGKVATVKAAPASTVKAGKAAQPARQAFGLKLNRQGRPMIPRRR